MTTTMQTVDNILKEVYEPRLRDQLQSNIITLSRVERTSEGVTHQVGGKYVRFPIRIARNHGIGARNEMEPLPKARTQNYESAHIRLKHLYGTVVLTGQTFELARTNPQAFASALELEVNGMRETLKKDVNRQIYGTSKGVLAVATDTGTTTTFITNNAQYVEHGMVVDIYDATDTDSVNVLNDSEVVVKDVADNGDGTYTITFDDTVTSTAAGDFLVRHGNRNKEIIGFDEIVNVSGDYDKLYDVEHSIWTANIDSTGGALSEGRMTRMVDKIRRRGGETTVMFASLGVRRAYANLLVQQRRYTNTVEFTGGFSGLAFTTDRGDIPIVADFDCQPGRLYFINEKELKQYEAGDWSFMNRDGNNWRQVTDSSGFYDAFRATFYKYCELGTHRRNSHGVMTGLTEA